jgi:hypothetical protein
MDVRVEREREREFLVIFLVLVFGALFPLCFPESLDLVYSSSITHFNSIFIQVKVEFS